MTKPYQVVGIGNALVDVISHIEDGFLAANGVERGIMQLIDRNRAIALYGRMGPAREVSGGSAANTVAGLAALGAQTAYVGKVKDDQLGARSPTTCARRGRTTRRRGRRPSTRMRPAGAWCS